MWASLMEEMWKEAEKHYGAFRVRMHHRASITLSGELDSDDLKILERASGKQPFQN